MSDTITQDIVEGRKKKGRKPFLYCDDCGHFFDGRDKRAFIPKEGAPYGPTCPACTMMTLRGDEAWAVWNDCNGVFADEVFVTAEEAAAKLTPEHYAIGGRVKPVRIYLDEDVLRNMQADALRPREIPVGEESIAPDAHTFGG